MEQTRIVITHKGTDISIELNHPEDIRMLTEMHCAFVVMFIKWLTEAGMNPEEAVGAVSISDEAAIKAFVGESFVHDAKELL